MNPKMSLQKKNDLCKLWKPWKQRLIFVVLSTAIILLIIIPYFYYAELIRLKSKETEKYIRRLDTISRLLIEARSELQEAQNKTEELEKKVEILTLELSLAGTGLEGLGQALVQAESETGINALVLASICAHESAWGTSRLARERNNLAGMGAFDDAPDRAMRFESREDCVMFLARLLRDRQGRSLEEIGTWYASDARWAMKVAGCMRAIVGAEAERRASLSHVEVKK